MAYYYGPEKPTLPPAAPPGMAATDAAGSFPSGSRGKLNDDFDVRDTLTNFITRGDKNLQQDQAKKDYQFLIGKLGADTARKLMDHVFLFNQRPEVQNTSVEKKLSSLYDIGSRDKDVDQVLKRSGTLGSGPVAGYYQSNQKLSQAPAPVDNTLAGKLGITAMLPLSKK